MKRDSWGGPITWRSAVTEQIITRMPMSKDAQCVICGEHVTFRTAEPVLSVQVSKKGWIKAERNYGRHKDCARATVEV